MREINYIAALTKLVTHFLYSRQRLFLTLSFLCIIFCVSQVLAICDCGSTIPHDLRVKKLHYGVGYTQYEKAFNGISNHDPLFEQLFKLHVAKYSNISGSIIKFKNAKKEVYRSSILSENIALLSELVKKRDVKTIVLLTNSKLFNIAPWVDKERSIFSALGGSQFLHVLDFDSHFNIHNKHEVDQVNATVTEIIKLIANASGNVLIHCLGGEHKTEIVFEVMQKCINKLDIDNITQRYKCHTGCINSIDKGGFRKDNINFIADFPCALINDM